MPVCGSLSWRADPHHEKELAFLKKDGRAVGQPHTLHPEFA